MVEGTKLLGLGLLVGLFIGLVLGFGLSVSTENQANILRTEFIERNITAEVEGRQSYIITTLNIRAEEQKKIYPECESALDEVLEVLE
jgi:hypothetical protein